MSLVRTARSLDVSYRGIRRLGVNSKGRCDTVIYRLNGRLASVGRAGPEDAVARGADYRA